MCLSDNAITFQYIRLKKLVGQSGAGSDGIADLQMTALQDRILAIRGELQTEGEFV